MQLPYYDYLIIFGILLSGFIVGIIFTKIIRTILIRIGKKKNWKYCLVFVEQLKGLIIISTILLALFFAEKYYIHNAELTYYLDKLSLMIIILAVGLFLTRVLIALIRQYYEKQSSMQQATSLINNIVRISVFIIALLIILQSLGISITPLLTALGVGGIAVSLALQDTLSNLFAGVNILSSGKIKVGDTIKLIEGHEGVVEDISWRYTTIKSAPGNIVIVPNSKLASSLVTNYSLPAEKHNVVIDLIVSMDSDLDKVEKIVVEIAKDVMKEIVPEMNDFSPLCRFSAVAEYGINLKAILQTPGFSKQFLIKHEFIKRILVRFRAENIIIPYPSRIINVKNN